MIVGAEVVDVGTGVVVGKADMWAEGTGILVDCWIEGRRDCKGVRGLGSPDRVALGRVS
jgi:hypothetical protein